VREVVDLRPDPLRKMAEIDQRLHWNDLLGHPYGDVINRPNGYRLEFF
jgi:hypothetical protein